MENKKAKEIKKAKTVAMHPEKSMDNEGKETPEIVQNNPEPVKQKYSYEELENIVKNLIEQNNNLVMRLHQYEELLNIKRLDYLFKVLENKESFSKKFVFEVGKEIEESLTIKEEESK